MKLFTRYNRINLLATVIIFLLSGISFYFLLRFILVGQVDEDLKIEQQEINNYVSKYDALPEVIPVKDQHISYVLLDHKSNEEKIETEWLRHDSTKEVFRTLRFDVKAGGKWYGATVQKSLEGTDDMMKSIISVTLGTILLILIVTLFVNRMILRKLWKPFYETLASMRNFELGKMQLPKFPATNIDEFSFMNATLYDVAAKADHDYRLLKEFTENASHELQTPLAIVQSKLDILIQDEHLSEAQSHATQAAYEAIQKLSRLNQSLLLLTRIENGQFAVISDINIANKITDKLKQFEEMIQSRGLAVKNDIDDPVFMSINPILADILLNNLLSNAIRYNKPGGKIGITIKKGSLEVSNSAINGALDEERLFRRFGKTAQVKDGIGIGLAIVKQVADFSGLSTSYSYQNDQHHFAFKWNAVWHVTENNI
jgi:signal transduction histidine kinase